MAMDEAAFTPVVKGQVFADSKETTTAIKQSFLIGGTGCASIGGGGFSKVFCCAGRKYDKKTKKEVGCRARIRACKSRRKNLELWKITEVSLVHNNCTGEQENASLASVQDMIAVLVRANPRITGTGIAKHLQTTKGISVHVRTALRARAMALGKTDKRNKEGFTALQSLLDQLGSIKGIHTDIKWEKSGRFKCCFVLIGGAAMVAARSPNKAFSLDGAHLNGAFNGTILTITTTDANNRINIVAFAVVRRENAASYKYLLQQAMRSKRMRKFLNSKTTTCFTDGKNGVDATVAKFCRLTEIRNCLEHLLRGAGRMGQVGKGYAYSAARSTTKVGFDFFMGRLNDIAPDAHDKLEAIPHERWAHYASRKNVCFDQVTTNPAESANSMLLELRRLPVYDLVHGSILLIAKRLCDASELKKDDSDQVSTPYAMEHFSKATTLSRKLTSQPLGGNRYLVSDSKTGSTHGHKASVAWRSKGKSGKPLTPKFECSCGVPQKMQLPCGHVLATVKAQRKTRKALSLISKKFEISRYRRLAAAYPIDMPVWDALEKDSSKKPPRIVKRLDGKIPTTKRTTRFRSNGEGPPSKKRKTRAKA